MSRLPQLLVGFTVFLTNACAVRQVTVVRRHTVPMRCDVNAPKKSPRSCERRCDQGDILACLIKGRQLLGRGEIERAAAFLDAACDEGHGAGCVPLVSIYARGEGVPLDLARASYYHRRACDMGQLGDCQPETSFVVGDSEAPRLDVVSVAAHEERACESGRASACFAAGLMHEVGIGTVVDRSRAARLYERACVAGHEVSCTLAPASFGRMILAAAGLSEEAEEDPAAARRIGPLERFARAYVYDVACRRGHRSGCHAMGLLYANGVTLPQDARRAEELYTRACEADDSYSCRELRRWRETPRPLVPVMPVPVASVTGYTRVAERPAGSVR